MGKSKFPPAFSKRQQEKVNFSSSLEKDKGKKQISRRLWKKATGKSEFPAAFGKRQREKANFLPPFQKADGKYKFPPRFLESRETKAIFPLAFQKGGRLSRKAAAFLNWRKSRVARRSFTSGSRTGDRCWVCCQSFQSSPGIMRRMNSLNSGTVKAVSPWFGFHTMPFACVH